MAKIISPKVNVIDFGPIMELEDGTIITPDEFVYGAANITYKNVGALNELIELKKSDVNISEKVKNMLIKVGGSGHASMATTPGFWGFIEGNASKLVDSIFTTAKFGSSLMPSGRRVPITKEAIVVPRGIANKDQKLVDMYVEQSEDNIQAYFDLQDKGVPKQEASKIVQYGHSGGGFMFMPLETLIHFSKLAERDPDAMPQEGHEIISQLEDFVKENGAEVIYHARKNAPRTGSPHPNIFHNRRNEAADYRALLEDDSFPSKSWPRVVSANDQQSQHRDLQIQRYLETREKIFSDSNWIKKGWNGLLGDLEEIVDDFNDTINIKTFTNMPWRVWGEVKRHRTMPQTAESIYEAVDRSVDYLLRTKAGGITGSTADPKIMDEFVSLPPSVTKDKKNYKLWVKNFKDSVEVYDKFVQRGIKPSDAITIIPRGIKLGVVKNFDLYNLTTGYLSLRLCGTAEPEMKKISELEKSAIMQREDVSEGVKNLLAPKCHYVGFCPETKYQPNCGKINKLHKGYNESIHKDITQYRINEIHKSINNNL